MAEIIAFVVPALLTVCVTLLVLPLKFVFGAMIGAYTALMTLLPTDRVAFVRVAMPPANVSEPRLVAPL